MGEGWISLRIIGSGGSDLLSAHSREVHMLSAQAQIQKRALRINFYPGLRSAGRHHFPCQIQSAFVYGY